MGQVMHPGLFRPWMASHAAYPCPILLGGRLRVFFVSRDAEQCGRVGWCDLDPENPTRVLAVSAAPVLDIGIPGAFDDQGIALGNALLLESGALILTYMGWNTGGRVPFRNAIGAAVDITGRGDRFARATPGPWLDRNVFDAFTLSYPFVRQRAEGWEMIYGSQRSPSANPMHHVLCRATSAEGRFWQPEAEPLLLLTGREVGHSRPWILLRPDTQSEIMIFSTSTAEHYNLAVAEADDGGGWRRLELSEPLIADSPAGDWAEGEACYAAHIRVNAVDYLFYCGRGYGRSGFGVARLEF